MYFENINYNNYYSKIISKTQQCEYFRVEYIKLIFAELEEHKKILIEISEKLDRIGNLLEK
ncbi:hypothetical protein [Methanocaldococcus sp.]